jgi:predicted amidohydrolase
MQNLKLTLIQADLHWQNPEKNRASFERKIASLREPGQVIILPEMFTTGFTMEARSWAEPMNGPSVQWMQSLAQKTGAAIAGSLIIKENDAFFNRFIWASPQGNLFTYDKRHLFRMAGEHEVYRAGDRLQTVELNGWRIRLFVCYDLRFPVWSRNVDLDYDVAVYVANWPASRISAWRTLLQARAAENQAYVIGLNRTGSDGLGIRYSGQSLVANAIGNIIADLGQNETIVPVNLSRADLEHVRQKFPAWKDADRFAIL